MSSNFKAHSNKTTTTLLSMRQGAMALRGITRFVHSFRNRKTTKRTKQQTPTETQSKKNKQVKKMTTKEEQKCSMKMIEKMRRETLFSRKEIEALYKIYKKLITLNKTASLNSVNASSSVIASPITASEGIDRIVFRELLHNSFNIITENMLIDRIFCAWDKSNCGLITLESWFHGMSLFLKSSTIKQSEYCFAVYDLNSDGFITKDEMFQLLKDSLIKLPQDEDPEESVKDLVDIIMKKMDKDKDGKVSLDDYRKTVTEEPLLLEAFGYCLPSEGAKQSFMATLKI